MRICSGAGCLRAVPDDVRYCHECASEQAVPQKKPTSLERDDAIQTQYISARWKQFRPLVLQRHPFCHHCKRAVSRVVDHVIPAKLVVDAGRALKLWPLDPWAGFYILDNAQGLCHRCHNEKTRKEPGEDYRPALAALLARFTKK